ncbi:MAG: YaaA family protein [Flavobacteriia bacterium]|nr:YaaA family protein [Flavobacteriia bacterium]
MKFILSPSKRQDHYNTPLSFNLGKPAFIEDAERIANQMMKFSERQLKTRLGISDSMAAQTIQLWSQWRAQESDSPAIGTFKGDVYDGLDFSSLTPAHQKFGAENGIIMSALYGVLSGNDAISPYRLDLKDAVKVGSKSLTTFWKPKTQDWFDEDSLYADLTSTEYKNLLPSWPRGNCVRVDFKESQNGKLKTVSFFAKKSRGMFAKWMIENRPVSFDDLQHFDLEGYRFNPDHSTSNLYMFVR